MKRILFLVLITFVIGFSIKTVNAGSLYAAWDYVSPPPDITGFNIYADNTLVHSVNSDVRDCTFEMDLTGELVEFTITALDQSNESARSEIFPLDPIPSAPTYLTVSGP